MELGFIVFAPIAHSHPIDTYANGAYSHNFWMVQDLAMLLRCDALVVHMLEGWDKSRGVKEEMDYAFANHIPIYFLEKDISEWEL